MEQHAVWVMARLACPIGQPAAGLRGKRDPGVLVLRNGRIVREQKRDKVREIPLGFRFAFTGNELPRGGNLLPKKSRPHNPAKHCSAWALLPCQPTSLLARVWQCFLAGEQKTGEGTSVQPSFLGAQNRPVSPCQPRRKDVLANTG